MLAYRQDGETEMEDITMTREEKINWLANATSKELVDQMRWTVTAMSHGSIEQQIEANEDYELVTAELLKRLG